MTFTPCAVIPSRNHYLGIDDIVSRIRDLGLPVILVDDASTSPAREALALLGDGDQQVTVIRNDVNQGKGGAVLRGIEAAAARGFSHVVQVDADGQHDLAALPRLVALARRYPDAVVSGAPVYQDASGRGRRMARWLTHVWIWIETLSFRIRDALCGFRVYPVSDVLKIASEETLGRWMDFDPEILVRLFWRGVPIVTMPVPVQYIEGNLSNFDMIRDNWRITKMHVRLVFTMLIRLPNILRNRPRQIGRDEEHWSGLEERGLYLGLRILAGIYQVLGRRVCLVILAPVVLYFYLSGGPQRRASMDYLRRIGAYRERPSGNLRWWSLKHFFQFAAMSLDKFSAWIGDIDEDAVVWEDEDAIDRLLEKREGVLAFCSHLGNVELSRAMAPAKHAGVVVNILVHTKHAQRFNRLIQKLNPAAGVNVLQVTEIGPDTALDLKERIDRGEWVVIAADRTAIASQGHYSVAEFLNAPAPFPHGPYIIASLLKCPVYLLFCLKKGARYHLHFELFSERVLLTRGKRLGDLEAFTKRYASRLEEYCLSAPLQWSNFYDFWAVPDPSVSSENSGT